MRYELWDYETGNRVGAFDTLEQALADVRFAVEQYGAESNEVQTLVLITFVEGVKDEETSGYQPPVYGRALAELAFVVR